MRILLIIMLLFGLTAPVFAQTDAEEEEDKTYLENLLQDALSGDSHTVRITGFAGALSSKATMQQLTVADEDGVWLTMRGATLDWSRSALLARRLKVTELSVEEITVERLPEGGETVSTEDSVATQFSLPDIPVAVDVQKLAFKKVVLGEAVLGEPVTLSATGQFALDDGAGNALVEIKRLDRNDEITLDASFSNETRVLAMDLDFSEDGGGLVSSLIGIPGEPSLSFQVTGEAPVSDYTANLSLSSDGVRRLGGTFRLAAMSEAETTGYDFGADLSGDLRPLFGPEMHPFFGEDSTLKLDGSRFADGRMVLDTLSLSSEAMEITGDMALAADGWPERFRLNGNVAADAPVRLPTSGPATTVESAELTALYDASEDDGWILSMQVYGLTREDFTVAGARVDGQGTIRTRTLQQITADLRFDATGLEHDDPEIARAMGTDISGKVVLDWQPDAPIDITTLELQGGDVDLTAKAKIDSIDSGFQTTGEAALNLADLSRFQGVAGRKIEGAAKAEVSGEFAPLGGAFDLEVKARTNGLQVDDPRADPVLKGESTLYAAVARSTGGTVLREFEIENDAVSADASGRIDTDSGNMDVVAELREVSLVEPRLTGPARVDGAFNWTKDGGIDIERLEASVATATLDATGNLRPEDPALPFDGKVTFAATDLSRFSRLASRPLAGAARVEATGKVASLGEVFDLELRANTRDVKTGEARVDPLLTGNTTLYLKGERDGNTGTLDKLTVQNDALTAEASGRLDADSGQLTLVADIINAGLVDPRLSGPGRVDGAVSYTRAGGVTIERLDATVSGAELSASGSFDPNDPDLPVSGKIALSAKQLSRFAGLVGQPIAGRVTLNAEGSGRVKANVFDATVDFNGTGFRTGIAQLDKLVAGTVDASFSGSLGDGPPNLRRLKLDSSGLTINASGNGPGAPISLSARLANLGAFAPGFPGSASANGRLSVRDRDGRQLGVQLTAKGPGGVTARIAGDITDYGQRLNLDVTGSAPMGLANQFITPRSVQGLVNFDLDVNGAPQLSSLSGRASFDNARVSLPTLNYALNNLSGGVQLNAGRANVDVSGNAGTGGQFRVSGPVQLTPGFPGNLTIALDKLGLFDPTLYQTTVGGTIEVSGNLAGGARIDGALALGPTELRVPSGSGSISGTLPNITHFYEPAEARQTRARAGLIKQMEKSPAAYPINLVINAPNRIFVRGRGLDAELGGSVRLTGTTANVAASGMFELLRGRLDLLGKRLTLTEGLIDLRGALNPYLRFVAETETDDTLIQIIIEGLADEPTVTFSSSPDLPQEEVVAQLLFGEDLASMSAFQAAQLVSAVATLTGRFSGGITGKIRDSLGLSDLDISTSDEGATQFTAGAYISDNVYSEVTADSDGNQKINLNLDLSRSVTIKGSAGNDGNTGIGIFYEKDY